MSRPTSADQRLKYSDLIIKVPSYMQWQQTIGKALVLDRMPQHLSPTGQVWVTLGNCRETLGCFSLRKAPYRAPGALTYPSKGRDFSERAACLEAKSFRHLQLPISVSSTTSGQPTLVPGPHGSFRYVRTFATRVEIWDQPRDPNAPRVPWGTWTPWQGSADPRLIQLEELVNAAHWSGLDRWFRKNGNTPPPSFGTRDVWDQATGGVEIDHLVPIRVLRDRLRNGDLTAMQVPASLLTVRTSLKTHRIITNEEAPQKRENRAFFDALKRCPLDLLPSLACSRYAFVGGLVPLDGASLPKLIPFSRLHAEIRKYSDLSQ